MNVTEHEKLKTKLRITKELNELYLQALVKKSEEISNLERELDTKDELISELENRRQ